MSGNSFAYKQITFMILALASFLSLFADDPADSDPFTPSTCAALLNEYNKKIAQYGLKMDVSQYENNERKNPMTVREFKTDMDNIVRELSFVNAEFVKATNVKYIALHAFFAQAIKLPPGSYIALRTGRTTSLRHSLYCRYDMFRDAQLFWTNLEPENFFFKPSWYYNGTEEMTYTELLEAQDNSYKNRMHFPMNSVHAQYELQTDRAVIFSMLTDSRRVEETKKQLASSESLRQRSFLIIRSLLPVMNKDFWDNLYHFTKEEWNEIDNSYEDYEKYTGIKVDYADNGISEKFRIKMNALLSFPKDAFKTPCISKIKVESSNKKVRAGNNKLILQTALDDRREVAEHIFIRYADRKKLPFKKLCEGMDPEEAARLFRRMLHNPERIGSLMAKDKKLAKEVKGIISFIDPLIPADTWKPLQRQYKLKLAELRHDAEFEFFKISFEKAKQSASITTPKKPDTRYEVGSKRMIRACFSVLSDDFITGTGIKCVTYVYNLGFSGKPMASVRITDTIYVNQNNVLENCFYELFLAWIENNAEKLPEGWPTGDSEYGKKSKSGSENFFSIRARESREQDMAETFSELMTHPCIAEHKAENSEILKKKLEYIKNLHLGKGIRSFQK